MEAVGVVSEDDGLVELSDAIGLSGSSWSPRSWRVGRLWPGRC